MAYYAALVSVIQLLQDIPRRYRFLTYLSLEAEFRDLKNSLEDYSPEDEATADSTERRIRDAAHKAQDIIETGYDEEYFYEELEGVKTDVGKVMEKLMRIKESYTSHQDHSAGTAGASTQASPKVGTSAVRSKAHDCADELSRTIQILQSTSHFDFYSEFEIDLVIDNLSLFQELLRGYSPEHIDKETADSLESQIDSATFRANRISLARSKYCESLQEVRIEVEFIKGEIMRSQKPKEHQKLKKASPNFDSMVGASKVRAVSGKNTVVGLDECLMTTIKAQLCGEPSTLQVVSIVGMGGVGKTTWAGNIFDDKLICERFDCRAWVTVSQDHHLRKILLGIVSSLNVNNIEELRGVGEQVLKERLYKHLFGRRYLIIMDDVWDTNFWDEIKNIFPDSRNGSRVMITTRRSDVARNASTSNFIHHIPLRNEDQSWKLFCERVSFPLELEHIGRSIVRKCGGLPLAIVVIAGLLSKSNVTKYDWEMIEMNLSSTIAKSDEHFSQILSLSYNFMPHHLKPCFLHLGVFPKDCQIQASRLVKIWVAEGFIEPTKFKSLEEVAEGYLEDLVNRNLVLIIKRKSSGKIKYCSIHDLLRELCLQRSSHENFLHVIDKEDLLNSEHIRNLRLHISHHESFVHFSKVKKYSQNVRSIYSFVEVEDPFLSVFSDFKLLRILNAVDAGRSKSPDEIVELLHLRYLGLPYLHVPPSISKLQNLETLVLEGDHTILPSEIWNMYRLRHVIIRQMTLPPIPQGKRPGSLQTLSTVVDFIFTHRTVQMIQSLKKLKVFYSEAFKSWDAIGLGNLVYPSQLETLHIEISSGESNMIVPVQPLPQHFGFPYGLTKLSLSGCRLPWSDMRVVGKLPYLQVLKLRLDAFLGEEWETIEGQFLQLKFLLMEKLLYLKHWRAENTTENGIFPRLERLIIRECQLLQGIPSEIGDISTLELIEVYGSTLAADSALGIQEGQRDNGNDVLQVLV